MCISRRAAAALLALLLGASAARAADRSEVVMPTPGQPYFVQLSPVFIPVIEGNRVPRQVSVALAVEIADGAAAGKAATLGPLLRDALITDLYRYVQQRGGIGTPEAETALKARLTQTAQRVLGQIAVKDVDLEEFFEQQE